MTCHCLDIDRSRSDLQCAPLSSLTRFSQDYTDYCNIPTGTYQNYFITILVRSAGLFKRFLMTMDDTHIFEERKSKPQIKTIDRKNK